MLNSVLIQVPGKPVPKGRPRFGNGRAYTDARTKSYETEIAILAKQAMKGEKPFIGAISVTVTAYMPTPKGCTDVYPTWHVARPDIDNLTKAALDGCNGIVFADDSQICHLVATKMYSDVPKLTIYISEFVPVFGRKEAA